MITATRARLGPQLESIVRATVVDGGFARGRHGKVVEMTTAEELEQWRGRRVVDSDGADLGKLEEVYFASGGEPVLVRVRSGLLGRHHALVPLVHSTVGRDYLRVGYRKTQIEHSGTEELGEDVDASAASAVGKAYGVVLPDSERGYESGTQIAARRAEAAAAQERAASLESQARQMGAEAESTRSDATEAEASAVRAERDAATAREEATDARGRADAVSRSLDEPPPAP